MEWQGPVDRPRAKSRLGLRHRRSPDGQDRGWPVDDGAVVAVRRHADGRRSLRAVAVFSDRSARHRLGIGMSEIKPKDVIQISAEHGEMFKACFAVVTDVRPWG